MSFLYPAFLLGGLAIALPIVLHLLRRDVAPEVPFTAVRLLHKSPIERAHRRRLRELILLAARIAALLLLAAAFARPYVQGAAPPPVRVIAVDRSYSMGARGVFDRALDLARSAIDRRRSGRASRRDRVRRSSRSRVGAWPRRRRSRVARWPSAGIWRDAVPSGVSASGRSRSWRTRPPRARDRLAACRLGRETPRRHFRRIGRSRSAMRSGADTRPRTSR